MATKNTICLITGANSGIGKVTARELARQGMHILMVSRNREKAEAARQEIISATGNQRVDLLLCDLGSLDDVTRLAMDIRRNYPRLDVLMNNAGLIVNQRETTKDGFEHTFGVNHLAPFLLTNLLLDWLAKSPEPRVITVSSEAHKFARLDFSDLQATKKYSAWVAYGNSKLANILFTRKLAQEVQPLRITANSLHPGAVKTNFGSSFGGAIGMFMKLSSPFFLTSEQGAETSIFLAASPEVKEQTGLYFVKKKPKTPSKDAQSNFNMNTLWTVSKELVRLDQRMAQVKQAEQAVTKG